MITTLTGKNQITIPAAVAARYRMQPRGVAAASRFMPNICK